MVVAVPLLSSCDVTVTTSTSTAGSGGASTGSNASTGSAASTGNEGSTAATGPCDCPDSASASTASSGGAAAATTSTGGASSSSGDPATTSSGGTGAGGAGGCVAPTGVLPPLKLTLVASGLDDPGFVTGAPGDTTSLYVVELDGRVKIVQGGVVVGTFLDMTSVVKDHSGNSEYGLLGFAFHPGYAQNGRFFVHYVDEDLHAHIAEYRRSPTNPMLADPTPVAILPVTLSDSAYDHSGGMLAFGPDGMLYAAIGDGAPGPFIANPAQDLSNHYGKILRIDVDSSAPPAGNVSGFIWDYGLRNPWRISFDRCTGDLYIGDTGEHDWEEIDVEPAGVGGHDYGWWVMEGAHCTPPTTGCDTGGKELPAVEYDHVEGAAVIGGYVYRGAAIPALRGMYVYGDYVAKRVWTFRWFDGHATMKSELTADLGTDAMLGISSFGEDTAGNLYVVDIGGAVYRIDPD